MEKNQIYNVNSNNQKGGIIAGKINNNSALAESETGTNWKKVSAITGIVMAVITIIGLIIKFYTNGK